MILHTLAEYHREQVAIGNPNYAPNGMELKRIHYVLVLSGDGYLLDIEKMENKICVVKSRERGGKDAPLIANRMWDNIGYVTEYDQNEKRQVATTRQHISFVEMVRTICNNYPQNRSFKAVENFYSHQGLEQLRTHSMWEEIIMKPGHNLSFRLSGEELLASQQQELLNYGGVTRRGCCVVCGSIANVVHTHPKLYITGAALTGAKLVSFTKCSGYDSYLKKGSDNAPVSEDLTESYTSALTGLLQPDSDNRMVIGNITFVFYTLPTTDFNKQLFTLFGADPNGNRREVLEQLQEKQANYSDAEFVLMALVPNAARISLRLYIRTSVQKVIVNILKFYEEVSIGSRGGSDDAFSLLAYIYTLSRYDNLKKIAPQLVIDCIESILMGRALPIMVQQDLLCRLYGGSKRSIFIYAMLKCYLIRKNKLNISMALDTEKTNIGYVLGRLLAISERAQEISDPNIGYTVRDMLYTSMSVTPSLVFNRLINSTGAFFRRIPTPGAKIFMKAQFGEVMGMLDGEIPLRLSFDEQSLFAIGYFHQRQSYYKKKENNEQDS